MPETSHGHAGREVRCRVFCGHAGRPGGLADRNRLSAWVAAAGGARISLPVDPGDNTSHRLRFTPDREGFWAVTVENVENNVGPVAITREGDHRRGTGRDYPDAREVGYYHHQYAKTWVQVGHLGRPYVAPEPSFEAGYLATNWNWWLPPGFIARVRRSSWRHVIAVTPCPERKLGSLGFSGRGKAGHWFRPRMRREGQDLPWSTPGTGCSIPGRRLTSRTRKVTASGCTAPL